MAKQLPKKYEKEINDVLSKKKENLTERDNEVLKIIDKAKKFFVIYDRIENKNTSAVFESLFLTSKNRKKSILAYAMKFGLSQRSMLRHKNKVLSMYICIYKENIK